MAGEQAALSSFHALSPLASFSCRLSWISRILSSCANALCRIFARVFSSCWGRADWTTAASFRSRSRICFLYLLCFAAAFSTTLSFALSAARHIRSSRSTTLSLRCRCASWWYQSRNLATSLTSSVPSLSSSPSSSLSSSMLPPCRTCRDGRKRSATSGSSKALRMILRFSSACPSTLRKTSAIPSCRSRSCGNAWKRRRRSSRPLASRKEAFSATHSKLKPCMSMAAPEEESGACRQWMMSLSRRSRRPTSSIIVLI
mmetsp:Transcript_18227/g.41417  ORF Transcript_18227/g.41417 Transcript_18227/m.41417 type:complete len:258 (+) Transcript_18227:129-902(+)